MEYVQLMELPIEAFIPHRKPMILIDRLIDINDDRVHCQVDVDKDKTLGPFLNQDGMLPSWFAIEIMAQSIAVWSGYHAKIRNEPDALIGLLLGARNMTISDIIHDGFKPGMILNVHSQLLMKDDRVGSFQCEISTMYEGNEIQLSQARLNTLQPKLEDMDSLFKSDN